MSLTNFTTFFNNIPHLAQPSYMSILANNWPLFISTALEYGRLIADLLMTYQVAYYLFFADSEETDYFTIYNSLTVRCQKYRFQGKHYSSVRCICSVLAYLHRGTHFQSTLYISTSSVRLKNLHRKLTSQTSGAQTLFNRLLSSILHMQFCSLDIRA